MAKSSSSEITKPFAIAAVLWMVVGFGVCKYFSAPSLLQMNLIWLFGLWALSLVDLFALSKTVHGMLSFASGAAENRPARVIHTFSWGLIKLVCLGGFALVMIKGNPVSVLGLSAGLGTLVMVPLVGGLIWSQKALGVS